MDWGSAAFGVPAAVKLMWPSAFNYQLMQMDTTDEDPVASGFVALRQAGDVFRVDGWYASPQNAWTKRVYELAAAATTTVTTEESAAMGAL